MMFYTYLIKFIPENLYYYGVSYKRNAHPDQLWKTYFTSSKIIKALILEHGKESFEFEIRKTFNCSDKARRWESNVLKRIKASKREDFLNKHGTASFKPLYGNDNPMKKDTAVEKLKQTQDLNAIKEGYISYADKISKKNPCNPKRLSETKKGKIWVYNEEGSTMISPDEKDIYLNMGYKSGRGKLQPCTDERKEKLRKYRTGTKRILINGKLKDVLPNCV